MKPWHGSTILLDGCGLLPFLLLLPSPAHLLGTMHERTVQYIQLCTISSGSFRVLGSSAVGRSKDAGRCERFVAWPAGERYSSMFICPFSDPRRRFYRYSLLLIGQPFQHPILVGTTQHTTSHPHLAQLLWIRGSVTAGDPPPLPLAASGGLVVRPLLRKVVKKRRIGA